MPAFFRRELALVAGLVILPLSVFILYRPDDSFLKSSSFISPSRPRCADKKVELPVVLQSCDDSDDSPVVFIVDQTGFGDFSTVQAAIDAVPDYNQVPVLILINNGTFTEKVVVSHSKSFITLQGQGMNLTTIAWNDTAKSSGRTFNSASFAVEAPDFVAKNISFQNTSPGPAQGIEGAQAVALRVSADRVAFYGCGFYGFQDTLFDDQGRHFFKECYIEGSIDFICGSGRSLYEDCEIHSVAKASKKVSGSITAQRRLRWSEASAFSFVNCRITGSGNVLLGRAWGPFSRVIFAYTFMDSIVHPKGWDDWGDFDRTMTVVYGEYECSGPGAYRGRRVNWSHALNDWEVYPYLSTIFIDGDEWLPGVASKKPSSNLLTHHQHYHHQLGVLDDQDIL